MASRRTTTSHNQKTNLRSQQPYRVVAFGQGGKLVSDHYLYTEDLAKMQLGIILKGQQYRTCRVVLYNPEGQVEFKKEPND
jgi:hypothetical protein